VKPGSFLLVNTAVTDLNSLRNLHEEIIRPRTFLTPIEMIGLPMKIHQTLNVTASLWEKKKAYFSIDVDPK